MKIAIAGYGAEGEASYAYWNTPDNQVVIVDEKTPSRALPHDSSSIIGEDAYRKLNGFDLVIRTPGLSASKITTDGKIWSATNEFFAHCPAPIIGVTGSKGKGTTSSLVAGILRAAGKTVHLLGNIGVPALGVLPNITEDDIVVYELSSFQLWDLERSPQVAVVLYVEPDHLDVHANFDEYVEAKAQITVNQSTVDRVVYNATNPIATQIAKRSVGQLLPYPSVRGAHVQGDSFYYGDQELCSLDNLLLVGRHNQDNACAAIAAVWPWVQDPAVIADGLRSFDGLPHRLKFVSEVNGVKYYDDSIATTPGSAIAAVQSFDAPKVLILGGSDKGAEYAPLYDAILKSDSMRAVITMGANGTVIADALRALAPSARAINDKSGVSFTEVIKAARAAAQSGDVVILSPAAASFDMFKNYADRGDQFIAAVSSLASK